MIRMLFAAVCASATGLSSALAAGLPPLSADVQAKAKTAHDRGVEFLLKQQRDNGQWGSDDFQPAITALALRALLGGGKKADDPAIRKGLDVLLKYRKDDGGLYDKQLRNYTTSLAVLALHAAGRPEDKPVIKAAGEFLIKSQAGADEQDELAAAARNRDFGGHGYGGPGRPDLSNTHLVLEALKETADPDDPKVKAALRRAQVFLSRMQLRSESNDQSWLPKGTDDGGFVYDMPKAAPAAGKGDAGPLRSYGSMTYAGFKSMLYAGLSRDDPRVKDAFKWICRHYSLAENPQMGRAGLFYYYHIFARALKEWGEPVITDRDGVKHDWRAELVARLDAMRSADGSWVNTDRRWMETDPTLCTCFALMALQEVTK